MLNLYRPTHPRSHSLNQAHALDAAPSMLLYPYLPTIAVKSARTPHKTRPSRTLDKLRQAHSNTSHIVLTNLQGRNSPRNTHHFCLMGSAEALLHVN